MHASQKGPGNLLDRPLAPAAGQAGQQFDRPRNELGADGIYFGAATRHGISARRTRGERDSSGAFFDPHASLAQMMNVHRFLGKICWRKIFVSLHYFELPRGRARA